MYASTCHRDGPTSSKVDQVDFSKPLLSGSNRLMSTHGASPHSIHHSTAAPPLSTGLGPFLCSEQLEGNTVPSLRFSPRFSRLQPHPRSRNLAPRLGFLIGTFVHLWIRTGSCYTAHRCISMLSPARVTQDPRPHKRHRATVIPYRILGVCLSLFFVVCCLFLGGRGLLFFP